MNVYLKDLLEDKPEFRYVVRLTTSCWHDSKGCYLKKSIVVQRRKSKGYDILWEECSNVGADEVLAMIENLFEVKDGLYNLIFCNESRDWETGIVDDYDLRLTPYKEESPTLPANKPANEKAVTNP